MHFPQPSQGIERECYTPFAQMDILSKAMFVLPPTLEVMLADRDPWALNIMQANMADNGVASPFVPVLLPDLSQTDKRIVIGVGIKRFGDITGGKPRFFWPPETAIDYMTLKVLVEHGIEGVFCSPEQIRLYNGEDADNMPTRIRLNGGDILAMPYDFGFSSSLAPRDNADVFTEQVVWPALKKLNNGYPLMGWADVETFGRRTGGEKFIQYLLNNALPDHGIQPVSINRIDLSDVTTAEGVIAERTVQSLVPRTNVGGKLTLRDALIFLNTSITGIAAGEFGLEYEKKMIAHFGEAFRNPEPPSSTPELSLISSKVSALVALTSGVPIRDARDAVEHLKNAGLGVQAGNLWEAFLDLTREILDPTQPGKTIFDMASGLLDETAEDILLRKQNSCTFIPG